MSFDDQMKWACFGTVAAIFASIWGMCAMLDVERHKAIAEYNQVAPSQGWALIDNNTTVNTDDITRAIMLARVHAKMDAHSFDGARQPAPSTTVIPIYTYSSR